METERTTEESMRTFVAEALAKDPEASSKQVAVRWKARRGEAISSTESDLLAQAYERQAPAAHEANTANRAAQGRLDSPPFRVTREEIAGLVAGLVPFVLAVESVNVIRRDGVVTSGTYFSLGGVLGGLVAIGLVIAIFRFAIQGGSTVRVKVGHAALGGIVLLLGVYHLLHGFGVLHNLGIYSF